MMLNKVLNLCSKEFGQRNCLVRALDILKDGGVIAVPTDTIYGLATFLPFASKLYDIKERNRTKPLALCVSDISEMSKYSTVTVPETLLDDLLPGPVTVVFERSTLLPENFNPETKLVGLRIPNCKFIVDLCKECGQPLALTSANISEEESCLSIQEFKSLWPSLDLIIDGGQITDNECSRSGSTVVDLSEPGYFTFLREGCAANATEKLLTSSRYGLVKR